MFDGRRLSPNLAAADLAPGPRSGTHREALRGGACRAAPAARTTAPAIAGTLIGLAVIWCVAVCAHVPVQAATTSLAVAYGALYLVLLPFHRWACFLVIVAACATEELLRAWSPIRYNTVHFATFLLLPVAYALVQPRARMPKPLLFWLSMCVWLGVSALWSRDFPHWLEWITEFVGVMCLALLTRQLATTARRRQEMGTVFAITSVASILAVSVVYGIGTGARLGNVIGIDMDPNGVARLAVIGMLMLAITGAEADGNRVLTPLSAVLYLALGVGLMLTQSRGSMLALAGTAVTFAWGQPRLYHRLLALALCGVLGSVLVWTAVQLDPTGMETRWKSTTEKRDLAGTTSGRSEIARTAEYILRDHWLAGVGAGQFANAFKEYSVIAHSVYGNDQLHPAHSAYLQIPTEGGLVATLLFVGFYGSLWMGASRLPPGQRRAVARAAIVCQLIGMFSDEGILKENWLLIGMLLVWFWENQRPRALLPVESGPAAAAEVAP